MNLNLCRDECFSNRWCYQFQVEKSVKKLSSKDVTPVDIISQALLSSKSLARNRKVSGNKGKHAKTFSMKIFYVKD